MPTPVIDIEWDSAPYTLPSPSVDDAQLSDAYNHYSLVYFPSSATITGVVKTRRGRPLWLTSTRDTITLSHDDSSSTAGNRLNCPGGVDLVLGQNESAMLVYDHTLSRWNVFASYTEVPSNPTLYKVLDASASAANSTGAQPWFPTAGAVALDSDTLYRFDGELRVTHGTISCAVQIGFGGTATYNFLAYQGVGVKRTINANGNTSQQTFSDTASLVNITTANTVGGAVVRVSGIVSVDAGGTFIPQFGFSAAPGSFPAVRAGTFFELQRLGADTELTRGTWS